MTQSPDPAAALDELFEQGKPYGAPEADDDSPYTDEDGDLNAAGEQYLANIKTRKGSPMTVRCTARWREPGPCGTPLVDGRCPNAGDHLTDRRRDDLLDAVEASIARHVEANRAMLGHASAAELVAHLERLARNPREIAPPMRRALVERAAEMIREEWL